MKITATRRTNSVLQEDKEGDIIDILCDCGSEHIGQVVGSEGQGLEWTCPITGEQYFDVNA